MFVHNNPRMYVYAGPSPKGHEDPQEWCVTRDAFGKPRGTGPTLESAIEDLLVVESEDLL
jgi:hypothetical protein